MSDVAKDLRIALLGCGRMGRVRAENVKRLGGSIDVAFDVETSAARDVVSRVLPGVDALDLSSIDALFVCTPPDARGEVELDALKRGLPVLVEKPLALDLGGASAWAQAARTGGGVTAVGYMNRYRPSIERAREAVRDEGVIALAGVWACGEYARDWWKDPARSGGPLNEQMTHLVDLMRDIGGEVREVAATSGDDDPLTAKDAAVALAFEGGHVGTIAYSCRASEKGIGLRVITPTRTLALEGWDFRDGGAGADTDPFLVETGAFLRAARDTEAPRPLASIEDAARTQAVVDAIRESIRSGRRQSLG